MEAAQQPLDRLNALLADVWADNAFYRARWRRAGLSPARLTTIEEFSKYPIIRKAEFLADQAAHPPFGTNRTFSGNAYTRLHRTSGTSGKALQWLDDERSWQALLHCSESAYRMAGVLPGNRIFLAARFGPSLGPWLLHESACRMGCLCIAPGECAPNIELKLLDDLKPAVLVGKPGKILALGRAAREAGTQPKDYGVRKIITVSEPGGSLAAFRLEIEALWAAECFDRYGMTEAGTVAAECTAHPGGMHILNSETIAEIHSQETDACGRNSFPGELVLTHLLRVGQPIVRYATGDQCTLLVSHTCACKRLGPLLVGGVSRAVEAGRGHMLVADNNSF